MAEFSSEWLEREGFKDLPGDFSTVEEFTKLRDGERVDIICEGFGFNAILNRNNKCFVQFNEKEVLYSELIKNSLNKEH